MVKRLGTNADVFLGIAVAMLILIAAAIGDNDRRAIPSLVIALATSGVLLQLAIFVWVKRSINSRIQAQIQQMRQASPHA